MYISIYICIHELSSTLLKGGSVGEYYRVDYGGYREFRL